ncbi:hypothetical protein EFP6CTSP_20775 [Enterococcus faecium]|nr:hypothetical protein EFP6CTSP_20775 [Enterococcus faecium]
MFFGALLPVVDSNKEQDQELLEAIYQTDTLEAVLTLIQNHYGIDPFSAKEKLAELVQRINLCLHQFRLQLPQKKKIQKVSNHRCPQCHRKNGNHRR